MQACAPLSPTAHHSIACRCSDCARKCELGGKGWEISQAMLQAKKDGRKADIEKLCSELEEIQEEMARL